MYNYVGFFLVCFVQRCRLVSDIGHSPESFADCPEVLTQDGQMSVHFMNDPVNVRYIYQQIGQGNHNLFSKR